MISCLFTPKEKKLLAIMFAKKERIQKEFKLDPTREQAYLRQRNAIIEYVLKCMGPALEARIKTWVTRKYCSEADARSLVYEHVLITVEKYCPSRGNCSVSSFLWTVSNRAFSNFVSAAKRQKRDPQSAILATSEEEAIVPLDLTADQVVSARERLLVSLDETGPYSGESSTGSTLADVVPDPTQMDESLNFNMILEKVNSYCTDQQKVLLLLLQQNYTYKEIAKQVGATPGTVSRQIQQLRKKLKHELKNFRHFA